MASGVVVIWVRVVGECCWVEDWVSDYLAIPKLWLDAILSFMLIVLGFLDTVEVLANLLWSLEN